MARHEDRIRAKKVKYVNLAEMQEMYRASHKITKHPDPDLYTFVPHDVEWRKGAWIVWRTYEEKSKSIGAEAHNEYVRLTGNGKPMKAPRPIRIPAAISKFIHGTAMQVPLNFAINTDLPRNWMRAA